MKYDELYKERIAGERLQVIDNVLISDHTKCCMVCQTPTRCIDICNEGYLCSEECTKQWYDEFDAHLEAMQKKEAERDICMCFDESNCMKDLKVCDQVNCDYYKDTNRE